MTHEFETYQHLFRGCVHASTMLRAVVCQTTLPRRFICATDFVLSGCTFDVASL